MKSRAIVLSPAHVVAIVDPRGDEPLQDALLRELARHGRASSQALADQLGVPKRTTQAMLQRLVDEGVCVPARSGRQIAYVLEDTTFAPPTDHGASDQAGQVPKHS